MKATVDVKFSNRVPGAKIRTEAYEALKDAKIAYDGFKTHAKERDGLIKLIEAMENENDRAKFRALLPDPQHSMDDLRVKTHYAYKRVVNGILKLLDTREDSAFYEASEGTLDTMIAEVETLFKSFESKFPISK